MENFEFKSAICTSVEQSKRLLKLGLKKETADMCWVLADEDREGNKYSVEYMSIGQGKYQLLHPDWYIPAWSLHRLLLLFPKEVKIDGFKFPLRGDVIMRLDDTDYMYERLIGIIERVIEQGYFNKDYLVGD